MSDDDKDLSALFRDVPTVGPIQPPVLPDPTPAEVLLAAIDGYIAAKVAEAMTNDHDVREKIAALEDMVSELTDQVGAFDDHYHQFDSITGTAEY